MLINSNLPQSVNYASATSSTPPQEIVWYGERCVVFVPANSLLCHGGEEITLALAEYAEQKKLTQESRRFFIKKRTKHAVQKIRARQEMREHLEKRKDSLSHDT